MEFWLLRIKLNTELKKMRCEVLDIKLKSGQRNAFWDKGMKCLVECKVGGTRGIWRLCCKM